MIHGRALATRDLVGEVAAVTGPDGFRGWDRQRQVGEGQGMIGTRSRYEIWDEVYRLLKLLVQQHSRKEWKDDGVVMYGT